MAPIRFILRSNPNFEREWRLILSRRKLNLTKILSRPIPGRFEEYRFMIEFYGAAPQKKVVDALTRLKELTDFLAIIGSYPVRRI